MLVSLIRLGLPAAASAEPARDVKGDRMQLVRSGKFLPYKYFGAEQSVPDYGFNED